MASSLPGNNEILVFLLISLWQIFARVSTFTSLGTSVIVGMFMSFMLFVCSTFLYEQPETNEIAGIPR